MKLALCPYQNKNCLNKIKLENKDLIQKNKFEVIMVNNIWDVLDLILVDNNITFEKPYTSIISKKSCK